jgi:hypothetical protein
MIIAAPSPLIAGESEEDRLKRLEAERLMEAWRESQSNLRSNIGSRLGMDDYFKVSSALAGLDSAGAKQVNAPRIAMGGRGSFSMPSGGLTASSVSKMMGVQDEDILARIIHMQSQAGLKDEAAHSKWYDENNFDPFFFKDSRDAFRATRGEEREIGKYQIQLMGEEDKLIGAKVRDRVQRAYYDGEFDNINDLTAWLDDYSVPSRFRKLAREEYTSLTSEMRSKQQRLEGVRASEDTHRSAEQTNKMAVLKETAEDYQRRLAEQMVDEFGRTKGTSEDYNKILEKYSDKLLGVAYGDPTALANDFSAVVGTRGERKPQEPVITLNRQMTMVNSGTFPPIELMPDGTPTPNTSRSTEENIQEAKVNAQKVFIEYMDETSRLSPVYARLSKGLREAQSWDRIIQLKQMDPRSAIQRTDVSRMQRRAKVWADKLAVAENRRARTDADKAEKLSDIEDAEMRFDAELLAFSNYYAIPYNMALYLYDEEKYRGPLGKVSD